MNGNAGGQAESGLRRLLYPVVLVLLFIAPSQLSYAVHPRHGPFITPADVLLVVVFVVWLIGLIATRSWRKLGWVPEPIWALLVVALLSATKAVDLKLAVREVMQFGLYFIAAYLLLVDTLRRRGQLRTVMGVVAVATSLIVLWGLADYLTKPDSLDVSASFGNRNVYSAYLVMVLPLLYGLAIYGRSHLRKVWLLAVVAVGAVTILSGPLFWCLVAVLMAMSVYHSRRTAAYYAAAAGLFLMVMGTAFPRTYDAVVTELRDPYETGEVYKIARTDSPEGADVPIIKKRWLELQPALMMLAHNPILGVGIGNYQLRIGEPQHYGNLPNVRKSEPDTNNLYLVIAGSTGLAGLVCLIALFTHFVRLAERMWIWAEDDFGEGLAAGLAGSLGAIVIGNFFTSLSVRGTAINMVLVLALIHICAHVGSVKKET